MPVYNGKKYLGDAIESILNQTYTDFEFIILNDGSTDKTEEIILSYSDPRIVYVRNEENLQIAKTLNKGIALAKGKYIARMDADDICLPERFEEQVLYMESHPEVDICGGWIKIIGDKNEIWEYPVGHEKIKTAMLFDSALAHPSVMFRAVFIRQYQYDEKYNGVEDYALWVSLLDQCIFDNIDKVILQYRVHKSKTDKIRQKELAQKVRMKLLKRVGVSEDLDAHVLENLSEKKFIEVNDLDVFFVNLLKINARAKYFDQKILREKIFILNWENINRVEKYSLKVLKYYLTSSFISSKIPTFYDRFIFCIKCIIGFKNDKKHTY